MQFYDIDSIFTFGKYEGETLAEVFEKDPKYPRSSFRTSFSNFIKSL